MRTFPIKKEPITHSQVTLLVEVRLDKAFRGLLVRPSIVYIMHDHSQGVVFLQR